MQLQQRLPGTASPQGQATLAAAAPGAPSGTSPAGRSRTAAAGHAHGTVQGSQWAASSPGRGSAGGHGSVSLAGLSSREAEKQYRGFLDALLKIGREEGLRGYYKGLGPSLVLVSGPCCYHPSFLTYHLPDAHRS